MDDIADRAGVSKPVLYQHFPGQAGAVPRAAGGARLRAGRPRRRGDGQDRRQPRAGRTPPSAPTSTSSTPRARPSAWSSSPTCATTTTSARSSTAAPGCASRRSPRSSPPTPAPTPSGRCCRLRAHRPRRDQRPVVAAAQGHRVPRRGGRPHVGAGVARHLRLPRIDGGTCALTSAPFAARSRPCRRPAGPRSGLALGPVARTEEASPRGSQDRCSALPPGAGHRQPQTPEEIAAEVSAAAVRRNQGRPADPGRRAGSSSSSRSTGSPTSRSRSRTSGRGFIAGAIASRPMGRARAVAPLGVSPNVGRDRAGGPRRVRAGAKTAQAA